MGSAVGQRALFVFSVLLPMCLEAVRLPSELLLPGASHSPSEPEWLEANASRLSYELVWPEVPRSPSTPVYVRDVWAAGHTQPHPELCPALGARLRLLILVTSAPEHAVARDAVRLTWGHYGSRSDVALAFVVGAAPGLESQLIAEDDLYCDLIRSPNIDSYSNLTLKTLSTLEWASKYCPRTPYLLKTDDSIFVNVPALLQFLLDSPQVNATRVIWGFVHGKAITRAAGSKDHSLEFGVSGEVFPDFAIGPVYLLTADCIKPLLAAAPDEIYLKLEDVFVTGVLAQKAGIARRHTSRFYKCKLSAHPCTIQRGFTMRGVTSLDQFDFWRKLLDGRTKCFGKSKRGNSFI